IDLTRRREQSRPLQPLDHVLFCLPLPAPLALHGGERVGARRAIGDVPLSDMQCSELVGAQRILPLVPPETRLCLEAGLARLQQAAAQVGFLAVDVCGEPDAGAEVDAPAVEMEILLSQEARQRAVGPVEAHDRVIAVFDPDSPREPVAFLSLEANV